MNKINAQNIYKSFQGQQTGDSKKRVSKVFRS